MARNATISAEAVVKAVIAGHAANKTIAQIAKELGFSTPAVLSVRLAGLRKRGVKVPKFAGFGGGRKLDVAALNKLIG